jgi:hypothetical protein
MAILDNPRPQRAVSNARQLLRVVAKEKKMLVGFLTQMKPTVTICYGKAGFEKFIELFPTLTWAQDDPFQVASAEGSTIILGPHFAARSMNGKIERLEYLATH